VTRRNVNRDRLGLSRSGPCLRKHVKSNQAKAALAHAPLPVASRYTWDAFQYCRRRVFGIL
jgi:hypothetical protein